MEYPGSKITKPIRNTILAFFLAIFFIVTPAIIMYTSGYRYDFKRGLLRETGAINIDIEPTNASVYLNDTKMKSGMPVRLNDRVAGKYSVLISSPGYFDWHKEVEVKNKQTVYIKEVSVLKKTEPVFIADGNIRDISLSPDAAYMAYIKTTSDGEELRARNLNDQNDILLYKFSINKIMTYIWSPNSAYIAVSETEAPHNTLEIINVSEPDKIIDVMAITKYPIDKYMWKETGTPELYFGTKLRLMSILPDTQQKFVLSKTDWLDWYMENGQLWTLQKSASTSQVKLVRDTLGFKSIFADEATFSATEQNLSILTAKDNQVLCLKNGKSEMILIAKNKKYNLNGEKFLISKYNDWWLIWTPWEIWTYSKDSEPVLLNRSGEGLREVIPLDKYNTLALIWQNKTTALYPYYLVTHDLVDSSIKSASADTDKRTLYFSAKVNDREGLWKLEY